MPGNLHRHSAQLGMKQCAVGEIAFEGVLDADRDAGRLELEPARVDPPRTVPEHAADAAR
jgi:hypothetical protein